MYKVFNIVYILENNLHKNELELLVEGLTNLSFTEFTNAFIRRYTDENWSEHQDLEYMNNLDLKKSWNLLHK